MRIELMLLWQPEPTQLISVDAGNLDELTDFAGYQAEFLHLFGFGFAGRGFWNVSVRCRL